MRLFKNRGDIYFSKVNKEKSREQRFLLTSLVAIVVFTVFFVSFLAIKYDFSAKEFFAPDEQETTTSISTDSELVLPDVEGKTNFLLCINKDGELLFTTVVQVDLDNISYKATIFKPETVCDGESMAEIYKMSGVESIEGAAELLLTTSIDYYVDMDEKAFASFYNDLGDVTFPVLADVKYKSDDAAVPYSIRIKSGEQKIKGDDFVNLIRYYLDQNMTSAAGDLFLASLQQHIKPELMETKESNYTELVTNSNTNITVKDFSVADTAFLVLTNEKVGVGVYNAYAEYDENEITNSSLQNIKGYFSK